MQFTLLSLTTLEVYTVNITIYPPTTTCHYALGAAFSPQNHAQVEDSSKEMVQCDEKKTYKGPPPQKRSVTAVTLPIYVFSGFIPKSYSIRKCGKPMFIHHHLGAGSYDPLRSLSR